MKNLSDENIMQIINDNQTKDLLWNIGMIVISIIFMCYCTYLIIDIIKTKRNNKRMINKRDNEENGGASNNSRKTVIEKENTETFSSLPLIIVLLIIAIPLGCGGFLTLRDSIDSSVSFRVEEKYVARADVYSYIDESDRNQLPFITYSIFICDDFSDSTNIVKHSVDGETYDRASPEFTKAYVAVNNKKDTIISIWNEDEYLYSGDYLIKGSE